MIPEIYSIKNKKWETEQTFTFTLTPKSSKPLRQPQPGQFNMLYAFGVGEAPISVSGISQGAELIHTIRNVGDVTRALSKLDVGGVVGLRGPFGKPWPIEMARGKDLVIIAGGVALAPVRPVIEYARSHRAEFRRVVLLLGSRTPEDLLFRDEFEGWGQNEMELHLTVDIAGPTWGHHVGLIPSLLPILNLDPRETRAMVCGPEIMMQMTALGLVQLGVEKNNIALSMERNMKCAIGLCGHCQYGPHFLCKDGPVYRFSEMELSLATREL